MLRQIDWKPPAAVRPQLAAAAALLLSLLTAAPSQAQDANVQQGSTVQLSEPLRGMSEPAEPPVDLSAELEQMRLRLAALEAAAATPPPALPPTKPEDTNKWTTKLGGHAQLDYVLWPSADPAIAGADNYVSYRRLRLVADGTGYDQFDFRLQMTLEPGQGAASHIHASPEVKDAYVSMNEIPGLGRLRIGNFFVPFSLEQVTNDTNNIFNERSIPSEPVFAASREVGIALYNCTADQSITWATGLFFDSFSDTAKTRFGDHQGYRLSGRLTALPYDAGDGRHLVHTGIGVLHTHDHDRQVRFEARPQVQRGPRLLDTGLLPASDYTTGNVEFAVVWGQLSVQAEAFLSSVDLTAAASESVHGGYVYASWFLTGESRQFEGFGQHGAQFGRNRPLRPFKLTGTEQGWGAWELKTRWSNLDLGNLNAGEYNDFTLGFNWYWSDRTRCMFDWIHPVTSAQSVFGETQSDLLALRFDFNW